jgi:hypothetical protein
MPTTSLRRALGVLVIGLGVAAATPAHATGCRVDDSVNVQTSVAGVNVEGWDDQGLDDGVIGEQTVTVTVLGTDYQLFHNTTTRSGGEGVVEALTGVDTMALVCG